MGENIHIGVPERTKDALGDLLARLTETRVRRGQDQVELREHLIRQINAAIRANLCFHSLEDLEIAPPPVQFVNLGPLLLGALQIQPAGNAQSLAVIREGNIVQAACPRPFCHLLHGETAIGPGRVRLQVSFDVAQFDQMGEPVFERGLDLAGRLSHLRRNPLHTEFLVHLLLAGDEDLAVALDGLELPFAERQPLVERQLADLDIVLLVAGKVLKRRPPPFRLEHAQVHLHAIGGNDACLGPSLGVHGMDLREIDERVSQSGDAMPSAQGRLALAEFYQDEGNFTGAIGEMEQVLAAGVADANLHYQYAQLLIMTGQYTRSVAELRKVLALNPSHTYAHNDLGVIYQQQQLFDEAIGAFEKAVSYNNRNYNALRNLIRLFLMLQKPEGALRVARLLITSHPDDEKLKAVIKEFDLPIGTSGKGVDGFEGVISANGSDTAREAVMRNKAHDYYSELKAMYRLDAPEEPIYRFVHPVWKQQLDTLGAIISQGIPDNFLYHPICLEMFVRAGWQPQQQYELGYLENLDDDLRERLFSIKETDVGLLPRSCPGHDISVNTLGMLWYCARIAERLTDGPSSVVEFGGGFGSFARVFSLFVRDALTYTIIDLPEMLALQLYYLGLALGDESVVTHTDTTRTPVQGKINLYPVYGLEELNISCDLFVSTFALSETPAFTQNMVCREKKFFGARHIYIAGQLETERSELGWQRPQDIVISALHQYKHLELNHFHIGDNYEMLGSEGAVEGMRISPGRPAVPARNVVTVVFSKDRAMQLHSTLRSLMLHCKDTETTDVRVLYTTSGPLHDAQYEELRKEFPSVRFVREGVFREDLLALVSSYPYVLFLVDDNIFVRDFEIGKAVSALDAHPDAVGFSLRLGRNTVYCYMHGKAQALPQFMSAYPGSLIYDWTVSDRDFGYPLEVSSSVYRVQDLLPLLRLEYRNPNTLELMLDTRKQLFQENRKSLLCFEEGVTFCNPVNMVQTMWVNRAGGRTDYSSARLAEMFEEGFRVDVSAYSGFVPNSCHQEVELRFLGKEKPKEESVSGGRPLVSIMIISYNGIDHIRACIESIKRNTPESHEIVVVDNARNDGSLEYVKSVPGVIVIENPTNIGYTPARAQAMSVVRGEYIISLDDDAIVTKGWVTRFVSHAKAHPELGIMGPRSNYVSGPQIVPEARYQNIAELEKFAEAWSEEHEGEMRPTHKCIGFCTFISRRVLDKIGCIDYNFGKLFGFDDDDYSLRAQIAGFRLAIADDIFIHHTGGPQGKGNAEYNESLMGAWEMFKKKWGLPEHLKYGAPYDLQKILSEPFDRSRHYTQPLDPASVLQLVHGEGGGKKQAAKRYYDLALRMQSEGNFEGALTNLEMVLDMDPHYPDANNDLGVLYFQKGDTEKALAFITREVELNPGNADSLKNKADLLMELGRMEEAIDTYGRVLAIYPESVDTLLTVGALNARADRLEDAMTFFARALEIDRENPTAIENIELVKDRMGRQSVQ